MPTADFHTWNFHNFHVQQDLKGGQFVSAESTLIAAGPPLLPNGLNGQSTGVVYPIGMLESVGLQQNKQLQRIFEIGSTRSYFIPGRTIGSVSIGRTFYFGPSLLRVLYAYYNQSKTSPYPFGSEALDTPKALTADGDAISVTSPNATLLEGTAASEVHTIQRDPGQDYFFIDLASDLFAQPTGMAMYFKDANGTSVGALYLEEAYVQGHQMTISSGSVLIMEGVSMQYDRIRPIKVMA